MVGGFFAQKGSDCGSQVTKTSLCVQRQSCRPLPEVQPVIDDLAKAIRKVVDAGIGELAAHFAITGDSL